VFGRVFDLIGTVCGFFIASYTGALLTATNQPVWSDSPWIAAMFLTSSATSGAAARRSLAELSGRADAQSLAKLEHMDASTLVLELCTISLFLASQRTASLPILELPPVWWLLLGTLGLGAFVPLLLHLRPVLLGRRTPMIAAMLVLVGGFVLRYSVLAVVPAVLDRPREVERTVSSPTPSRPRADADAANDVWVLMRDRLEVMEAVACAKWHAGSPIEDPAREQALLDSARAWAEKRHVEPKAVESFLRAQIEAAKQVQRTCFADWQDMPPSDADPPNLTDDLRPRLDAITDRLLDAFVRCRPTLQDERLRDALADRMHAELERTRLDLAERRELLDNVLRAARISSSE
jgi:chorismate mutase